MRQRNTEGDELVDVAFDNLLRQTEKAFLVDVEGEEAWVAKVQVDNADELEAKLEQPAHKQDGPNTIKVPKWLAVSNGWIDDD